MRKMACFGKGSEQNPVQIPRGLEVGSERFFDDHAGILAAARFPELFDDRSEQAPAGWPGSAPAAAAEPSSLRSASNVAESL